MSGWGINGWWMHDDRPTFGCSRCGLRGRSFAGLAIFVDRMFDVVLSY